MQKIFNGDAVNNYIIKKLLGRGQYGHVEYNFILGVLGRTHSQQKILCHQSDRIISILRE